MPVLIKDDDEVSTVELQGEVLISEAEELKSKLLQAISSPKNIRLDLAQVSELDLTAMQLIWAGSEMAKSGKLTFHIANAREPIRDALQDAGFRGLLPAECTKTV